MAVREARVADAEGIARVHVRAWQRAYAHVFPAERLATLSVEERAARWRGHLAGEHATFVAETERGIAGFCSVGPSRDPGAGARTGEVYAVYVDPDAWGQGTGRRLLARGEQTLADQGFAAATLWVLEDNPRARRFYEAAGWRDDGRKLDTHLGVEVAEVRLRKSLL